MLIYMYIYIYIYIPIYRARYYVTKPAELALLVSPIYIGLTQYIYIYICIYIHTHTHTFNVPLPALGCTPHHSLFFFFLEQARL